MAAHARLSPSSSARWTECTASLQLIESLPPDPSDGESVYSREGTLAHTLGELEAGKHFGLISDEDYAFGLAVWEKNTPDEYKEDMWRYTALYVQLLDELKRETEHSAILLEQRYDTGVPGCWGTADATIMSPKRIRVIDLKYGRGHAVRAENNPQLMLYGVGALDACDILGTVEDVVVTIFQPRLGSTSHFTIAAQDLRDWRDNVVAPAARAAISGLGVFVPSEDTCRFCPAAGSCKPRMNKMLREDFGDPNLMTPEDTALALSKVKEIKQWCADLEQTALTKAYDRAEEIPGWKVVLSGGRRFISDQPAAVQTLIDHGYTAEQVAKLSLRNLSDLERLVGKRELPELLGSLLVKGDGKPSLVPATDERAEVNSVISARRDFD